MLRLDLDVARAKDGPGATLTRFARGEADATVTTLRTGGDDGTRQDRDR